MTTTKPHARSQDRPRFDPRIPAYIKIDLRRSIRVLNECNASVHADHITDGRHWAGDRSGSRRAARRECAYFIYRQSCKDLRAIGIDPMPLVLAFAEEVAVPLRGCLHERRAI